MTSRGIGKYNVPFVTQQAVDIDVDMLLAEYGNKHGQVLAPPIPVEEIIELYLELELAFLDMQAEFGTDKIHGALWVNEKRIGVEQSLEPDTNPSKLGRYRFTLGHEVGHWRLHRRKFQHRVVTQTSLLPNDSKRPEYICRDGDNDPIEVQADMYAATLLMPAGMVRRKWHELTVHGDPISLEELRADNSVNLQSEIERRMRFKTGSDAEEQALMEVAAQPMADAFEVSAPAMKNRLLKLNLLVKTKEKTLFDDLD